MYYVLENTKKYIFSTFRIVILRLVQSRKYAVFYLQKNCRSLQLNSAFYK